MSYRVLAGLPSALAVCALCISVRAQAPASKAQPPKFTQETTESGVTERRFELTVNGQKVPGILWTPEGAQGKRPLVCLGHGGSQHKRAENLLRMARDLVSTCNYAVVAIDGPGHGDRVSPEEAQRLRSDSTARRGAVRAVDTTAEWMATLDAVRALDYVGEGPVGYWGVSMGCRLGVPFVAADKRVNAAIVGLFGLFPEGPGTSVKEGFAEAARNITVPLLFVFQWEDQLMSREDGIKLFDAFGSKDKAMHINPGQHTGIPASERETWKPFFVRHLGTAKVKP